MVTNPTHKIWIVLTNFHQARLLACSTTPTGHCHIVEVDTIESPPSRFLRDKDSDRSEVTGDVFADSQSALEEEHRRFAKTLALWVDKVFSQNEIEHLTIFAPPRSIGYLRQYLGHEHREQIDLQNENLIQLPDDALQRHPAIAELMYPTAP